MNFRNAPICQNKRYWDKAAIRETCLLKQNSHPKFQRPDSGCGRSNASIYIFIVRVRETPKGFYASKSITVMLVNHFIQALWMDHTYINPSKNQNLVFIPSLILHKACYMAEDTACTWCRLCVRFILVRGLPWKSIMVLALVLKLFLSSIADALSRKQRCVQCHTTTLC